MTTGGDDMHEAVLQRIEKRVNEIHTKLFGNGREGLIATVARVEEQKTHLQGRVDDIEARSMRHYRLLWGALAIVGAHLLTRLPF